MADLVPVGLGPRRRGSVRPVVPAKSAGTIPLITGLARNPVIRGVNVLPARVESWLAERGVRAEGTVGGVDG